MADDYLPSPSGDPLEPNAHGPFLRRVTDLVDAAIYVFDLGRMGLVYANSAALRLYGVAEAAQVEFARFVERLHPADHQAGVERLEQLRSLPDGEWAEWTFRLRHADGSHRWLLARDTVFARDAGGAVTQLLGTIHDVTDRRLAEEHQRREGARAAVNGVFARALAASGAEEPLLLRSLTVELAERLEAGCVIVLAEEDGPYVLPAAWHHQDEQVLAALGQMFLQAPWRRDAPPVEGLFRAGEPQLLTPEFIDKVRAMGGHTWVTLEQLGLVEAAIVPLWMQGAVAGALCLMRFARALPYLTDDLPFLQQIADGVALAVENARLLARLRQELAERRLAEVELRRSRDLLQLVFEGLDEALLLVDGGGTVLAANQRFAALCGVGVEALVGGAWGELGPRLAPSFPADLIDAGRAAGAPLRRRVRAPDASGRTRILDLQTLPLAATAPAAERLVVRVVDVTEQVQTEARIIAAERLAANERLAATVAHEVNTPLQAIESSLHLAGRITDEEQRRLYLRLAREEIQRVAHILRQLLDLHRPQAAPAPLQINELVERVLLLSGGSLRRAGIQVARELAGELPPLVGRADELTQVLLNLIFNAIQAMPGGGRLAWRTEHACPAEGPELVVVTVTDSGPGVDPALAERIFEPFFTTRPEGSGLGLAVSRQIVEGHRGRITLGSGPEGGASFRIELPVSPQGRPPG